MLWLHPGPSKPGESSTPNHAHTRTKTNKQRKKKQQLTNVKCSFHSQQFWTTSTLCFECIVLTSGSKPWQETLVGSTWPLDHMDANSMGDHFWGRGYDASCHFVHQTYRRTSCQWSLGERSNGTQPCTKQILVQFVSLLSLSLETWRRWQRKGPRALPHAASATGSQARPCARCEEQQTNQKIRDVTLPSILTEGLDVAADVWRFPTAGIQVRSRGSYGYLLLAARPSSFALRSFKQIEERNWMHTGLLLLLFLHIKFQQIIVV